MVYQLATQLRLQGYVKNGSDGVHVFFNADESMALFFFQKIKVKAPPQSKIISATIQHTENLVFENFSIETENDDRSIKNVLLCADTNVCTLCRKELQNENNRRYRYPFITCTQCGPRYSIIKNLPYERTYTSMQAFEMCEKCKEEYNDFTDRRFFSQTNSCADCGIQLSLNTISTILSVDADDILEKCKVFIAEGKILAVKGIGGYLLLCAADNSEAIQLLRNRKHRPAKPLAVLYPDIETVKNSFELNRKEEELLLSKESPIVLLHPKQMAFTNLAVKDIAPGLNTIGVMLPYSPLLELIVKDYGIPLIATSANISGSPIIYKDDDALEYLFEVADYIISYNRDIIIPQDDSVVQISKNAQQQIMLRRSRGCAPSFLNYTPQKNKCVLSTGAFLKSSFSLSVNGNVFVSQFLGSGESYESQKMYKDTLKHLVDLYVVKPDVIIADLHPNYFSHQYAIELGKKYTIDVMFVQHHEAHFAAVLAENNLLQTEEPVLGVIWDGTGLGNDGNIWGGEFFVYENKEMLRCYHFDYFPAIAGDKLALEPRIAALCVSADAWPQPDILKEKFTDAELNNYQSLIQTKNRFSSSVGRIFDAVASLLGICDKQTSEGEAAMYLQVLAENYVEKNGFTLDDSYFKEGSHYYRIPTASLIQGIVLDIKKGKARDYIAAKFHYSLVCLIDILAKNTGTGKICFSGGVFQNALLVDWLQQEYKNKYQLYFHQHLSPNDENISFGQLVYFDNDIRTVSNEDLLEKENLKQAKRNLPKQEIINS